MKRVAALARDRMNTPPMNDPCRPARERQKLHFLQRLEIGKDCRRGVGRMGRGLIGAVQLKLVVVGTGTEHGEGGGSCGGGDADAGSLTQQLEIRSIQRDRAATLGEAATPATGRVDDGGGVGADSDGRFDVTDRHRDVDLGWRADDDGDALSFGCRESRPRELDLIRTGRQRRKLISPLAR